MELQFKLTNNGEPVSMGTYQFKSFGLNYGINSYPGFNLILTKMQSEDQVANWKKYDFLSFKDLNIRFRSDLFNFESDLGVNNVFSKTLNTIVVQGLLCKLDMMSTVKSRYLGNEVKEAIRALGFKQELNISNNQYDYFQLNTSDVNCLHSILMENSSQSVYSITEDTIRTIKLDSVQKTTGIPMAVNVESIQFDPQFKLSEMAKDTQFEVYNEEVGGKKFKLGMANQYNWIAVKDYYTPVTFNMISNLIYSSGLNYRITTESTVITKKDGSQFQVGDVVTLPYSDLPIKNFIITEVSRTLNLTEISSVYTLQSAE